jgi:hypothetical protein
MDLSFLIDVKLRDEWNLGQPHLVRKTRQRTIGLMGATQLAAAAG